MNGNQNNLFFDVIIIFYETYHEINLNYLLLVLQPPSLGSLVSTNTEITSETINLTYTLGRTPWKGDQPLKDSAYTRQHIQEKLRTYIHMQSGVRSHDPSVRAM
jgi:hypothetical protein